MKEDNKNHCCHVFQPGGQKRQDSPFLSKVYRQIKNPSKYKVTHIYAKLDLTQKMINMDIKKRILRLFITKFSLRQQLCSQVLTSCSEYKCTKISFVV